MANERPVRLSHLGMPVTNLDKSISFYEKWAAMRVQERVDESGIKGARLAQKSGAFTLSLLEMPQMRMPMPPIMHLGLNCSSREQVDKIADDARAAGILVSAPVDSGDELGYQAYISDPDGNNIEFAFGQRVGLLAEE